MADAAAQAIFEKYDLNKDGTLSQEELGGFYADLSAARADLGLAADGFSAWFSSIDIDASGTISPEELAAYLASINYSA